MSGDSAEAHNRHTQGSRKVSTVLPPLPDESTTTTTPSAAAEQNPPSSLSHITSISSHLQASGIPHFIQQEGQLAVACDPPSTTSHPPSPPVFSQPPASHARSAASALMEMRETPSPVNEAPISPVSSHQHTAALTARLLSVSPSCLDRDAALTTPQVRDG